MNETQQTTNTVEEIKSTVIAFSDWLDLNSDGYLMIITKGEDSMLAAKGKHNQLVDALASGMIQDKRVKLLIQEAARIVMAQESFNDMIKDKNK